MFIAKRGGGIRLCVKKKLSAYAFDFVALRLKQCKDFIAEVALDDDLSVFCCAAYSAGLLKLSAEFFKVVVGTYEAFDECDCFAATLFAVAQDFECLLIRRRCGGFGFVGVLILEVGGGGIDYSVATASVLVFHVVAVVWLRKANCFAFTLLKFALPGMMK